MVAVTPSSSARIVVALGVTVVVMVLGRSGGAECRARRTANCRRAREGVRFKGGGAGGGLRGG